MIRRSLCGAITAACVLLATLPLSAEQAGRTLGFAEQGGRSGTPPDSGRTLQWLSVVLLMGSNAPGADAEDIPPAVQRALADVRGFLPFKSYQMYDAGLMGPPIRGQITRLRLRGANPQQTVEATVSVVGPVGSPPGPVTTGPLSLNFTLYEVHAPALGADGRATSRTLMTNAVSLDLGETIVVGTSRVGGTGLIVLLTAVPTAR